MSTPRRSPSPPMTCVAAFLVIGAPLVGTGCRKSEVLIEPPPPEVEVVDSRLMTVPIIANPTGTTRALEDVSIRARVRGFLTERHFDEGSFVKKDQLLFVIDEEPFRVSLLSAQAKLAEAQAAVTKAEQSKAPEVAAAQLALDQAQMVLAQVEERRARMLVARNAGTREDLDKAEADRKKFEAQVEADKANSEQSKADYTVNILSAKARVADAEAAARSAQLDLGYCRMFAPFAGRIGEAKIKVGNLVGPTSPTGSDNTVLATIQQLDPMGVDVQVSSRYLDQATQRVRQGLKNTLTRPGLQGEQEHPQEGICYFIDNTIDPTTSTFLVKSRIPNPGNTLLPGEYVRLRIVVDTIKDAVVVPEQAVTETQAGPVVYVVDREGKVAVHRVEAAQTYERLRIVAKGLEAGVPVIVEGLQLVRPGMRVKMVPAELPKPLPDDIRTGTSPTPASRKDSGKAPGQPDGNAAPHEVEPGGPRSAVKAEEEARPSQTPASTSMPKP